jgi:hemerythrin-like domain-containing protein
VNRDRLNAWGQELRLLHDTLRHQVAEFRLAINRGAPPPTLTDDLRLFCAGFCATLTTHHTAEDGALFPRVLGRRPDLTAVVAKLIEDHALLASLITGLDDAIQRDSSDVVLRHLDGIEAIMTSHFGFEERQLVELMDAMTDHAVPLAELLGIEPAE